MIRITHENVDEFAGQLVVAKVNGINVGGILQGGHSEGMIGIWYSKTDYVLVRECFKKFN